MAFFAKAAGQAADAVADVLKRKLEELEREKDALADRLKMQALEFRDEKAKMLEEFKEEKKQMLLKGFLDKYNAIFDYLMNMVLLTLKDRADDPYMPRWVKRWIDSLIDAIWPDVTAEVKTAIVAEIAGPERLSHQEPMCCGRCNPLAIVRYQLYPYDRNIWRNIRNLFWWFCFVLSIFPLWGVSQFYYFVLFVFIDKRDEFSLYSFITEFKSFQFASLGLVSAILGSVQYYVCTASANCDRFGPRIGLWVMILFVLQIIVVWSAFLLIRCARRKGGMYYQQSHLDEEALKTKAARQEGFVHALRGETMTALQRDHRETDVVIERQCRNRLMKLLIYDLLVFLICVGLVVWATWWNALDEEARINENPEGASEDNWIYNATLFWIRAFYGFMSFPFVLLRVPGVSSIFSHARPTGYNPWGRTVPYLGEEEDGPVPWDPERPYKDAKKQAAAEKRRRNEPVTAV